MDYLELGSSPADEDCAQLGTDDYAARARAECQRYIALIRQVVGPEPAGAHLRIKGFPHDFGTYYAVVCAFTPESQEAIDYAWRCDAEAPTTWNAAHN